MSRRLFRSTKLSQGGLAEFDPADALFNHAGTLIVKSFLEVQEHEWDWLMAVNVKSMYLVTQAVLPQMISNGAGSIVCTSSISAQYATQAEEIVFICALPDIGHLAYSLMRLNASPKFSSVQFEGFQMCQTMVDVLLRRHFQGLCTHVDDSGLALREHLNNAFSRFAADQLTPPRTIDSQHDPAWTLPLIDLTAPWHRRGYGEKTPQALVLQTRHFQSI